MKRIQTTDFDVITGPSMASACPVVETVPHAVVSPTEAAARQTTPPKTDQPVMPTKADAA